MELIQALGLAHGGSQIQASFFSARTRSYPSCSSNRVAPIRHSGFKYAHSRKVYVRCSEDRKASQVVESMEEAGVMQAALEEICAETTQFRYEDVMAAATKVADALSEDEVTVVSFPASPMGAAVVTVLPSATEEEAVEEEVDIGFMVEQEQALFLEEKMEEEPLLEPGAVASAVLVKEVADALKTTEKETEVDKTLLEQLKDIFVFAGPALGIWLSGPIMGIIDTAVIGQSSSLELAALGPGTVLCDSVCYVFMFLSVATSNLVATSLAHKDKEEAARHLSRMLFLALTLGLGLLIVTEVWVTELLQAFVGAQNYDLIPAAKIYVQIRALAWPAVLVSLVSQSASLAMMDSKNPLKVLVIGSLFNLAGDITLCTFLGYGIAGAAWATIVAQYVAGSLMALSLNDKGYSCFNIQVLYSILV